MSINNLLFSVQNMSPAMLGVGSGADKAQNYNNLAQLSGLLSENNSSGLLNGLGSNKTTDTVSLTYNNIGNKIVSDMASVTAATIKEFPELDDDYVIVLVDDGQTREARVYSRKDILDNFEGTEAEKAALEKQLKENPLMVYNNASGLPETKNSQAYKTLQARLNEFLSTNKKTLDVLDKAGYDPLTNMLGNSTMKKIIANCALPVEVDKKDEDTNKESNEDDKDKVESSPED